MVKVLEYTTEEQYSVGGFSWAKPLNAKDIHKEIFHICVGKCLSRNAVQPWWQTFAHGEEVETKVRKCLRQKPKDFYAAGFDALVKRRDKCISVIG
jgi:hypothetical protein